MLLMPKKNNSDRKKKRTRYNRITTRWQLLKVKLRLTYTNKIQKLECIILLPAIYFTIGNKWKNMKQQRKYIKKKSKAIYLFHRKYHWHSQQFWQKSPWKRGHFHLHTSVPPIKSPRTLLKEPTSQNIEQIELPQIFNKK